MAYFASGVNNNIVWRSIPKRMMILISRFPTYRAHQSRSSRQLAPVDSCLDNGSRPDPFRVLFSAASLILFDSFRVRLNPLLMHCRTMTTMLPHISLDIFVIINLWFWWLVRFLGPCSLYADFPTRLRAVFGFLTSLFKSCPAYPAYFSIHSEIIRGV